MSILGVVIGEREVDSGSSVRFAGVFFVFCRGGIELVAHLGLVILLFFPVPLRLR